MRHIEATLIESFLLLNRFFQEHNIRYCLIGGIAAGFWSEPRYTQDMDFTVVSKNKSILPLTKLLQKEGFQVKKQGNSQCQITQKGSLQFQADLILAETNYQDWVVARALEIELFDSKTYICSAEDIIILKLIAHRRQDLLDIENVLKKNASMLDQAYLKKWITHWKLQKLFQKEFSDIFELSF